MKASTYWFIFLLYSTLSWAQNPELTYKKYTVKDGLPSSEVYHCLQDRNGHLWFATDRGIARYDGYEFTTYNTEDGLTDNVVFEFFEDHRGRIWILPMSGKLCYFDNNSIVEYPYHHLITEGLTVGYGHSFYVDTLDNVYFGTKHSGLKIITSEGEQTVLREKTSDSRSVHYREIAGQLLSYGNRSAESFTPPDNQALSALETSHYYDNRRLFNSQGSMSKRSRAFAVGQGLVCNSGTELFLLNPQKQITDTVSFNNRIIYFDKLDEMIIVGVFGKGLYIYKVIDQKLALQYHLLRQYTCSSLLQDEEGGFWITTTQQGVFYTPTLDIVSYDQSNGLLHDYVYRLEQDEHELLIAYPDTVQKFGRGFLPLVRAAPPLAPKIFLHDTLLFNRRGCLIYYADQCIFDLCKNKRYFASENQESSVAVPYQDMLYLFNINKIFRYAQDAVSAVDTRRNFTRIEDLEIFGKDSLWIAGTTGLYRYTPGKLESFAEIDPVFSSRIVALDKTTQLGLVVATRGDGLIFYQNDQVRVINKTNGLSTNDITSIYVDTLENIWVATNQGLHMINSHQPQQVEYYSTNEGLISNEITDVRRIGDKVYVGTKKGLSVIDLNTFTSHSVSIGIKVREIQLDGSAIAPRDTLLLLNTEQHYLDIQYTGVSFRAAGNIQYRYRIAGQTDTQWTYTQEQALKLKTPHQPGRYQVEISARILPNGQWRAPSQIISLQVELPFYKTSFFLFSFGSTVFLLVYLGFRTSLFAYPKHVLNEIFKRVLTKLGRKSFLVIKVDKKEIRINEAEILYLQSHKDYVEINTLHTKYLYRSTLKDMEKRLSPFNFLRVHRSYIVAVDKIDAISKNQVKLLDVAIPIGKTYRTVVKPLLDQFAAINS